MGREFVLVYGMSHGAWTWEPLARRLEKRGHHVVAMDLPRHGRRAHEDARASVETDARAVADAMMQAGIARGIVAGHSMGGVVIPVGLGPHRRRRAKSRRASRKTSWGWGPTV